MPSVQSRGKYGGFVAAVTGLTTNILPAETRFSSEFYPYTRQLKNHNVIFFRKSPVNVYFPTKMRIHI
jgi:hypothetical protein